MTRFSFTIPSLAAKNARTCLRKCCSSSLSCSQSLRSSARSISSAVQKEAACCLYIPQISSCSIGKSTNRSRFSCIIGSMNSCERSISIPSSFRLCSITIFSTFHHALEFTFRPRWHINMRMLDSYEVVFSRVFESSDCAAYYDFRAEAYMDLI